MPYQFSPSLAVWLGSLAASLALSLAGWGEAAIAHSESGSPTGNPVVAPTPAVDHSHTEELPHHGTLDIPPGQPLPTVKLIVHPDALHGVNLEVVVTNFTFAPERVNQKPAATEGHAHLYVDGKKVTRLYGNWYYLDTLSPGSHTITVTLNTNQHEDLTYKGKPIQATQTIAVPKRLPR